MSISTELNDKSYAANGATVNFALSNLIYFSPADLAVWVVDTATGVGTLLVINVGYTLSGDGTTGNGSLHTNTTYPAGKVVRVRRITPATQPSQYPNDEQFDGPSHERTLDRQALVQQRMNTRHARAMRTPDYENGLGDLPNEIARADKVLGFDGDGDPAVSRNTLDTLDEALDHFSENGTFPPEFRGREIGVDQPILSNDYACFLVGEDEGDHALPALQTGSAREFKFYNYATADRTISGAFEDGDTSKTLNPGDRLEIHFFNGEFHAFSRNSNP